MDWIGRFFKRWQNWLGLVIILLFIIVAIAAPALSPQDPKNPGVMKIVGNRYAFDPKPPSAEAPLGTLSNQANVYHALIWGTRSALIFGIIVIFFAVLIGVLVGTFSAFFNGFFSRLLSRITDAFLAFLLIAGVILIQQLYTILLSNAGASFAMSGLTSTAASNLRLPENMPLWLVLLQKIDPILIAFILFSWMPFARLMKTTVSKARSMEYAEAARALGVKNSRIIFRHLLPNSLSPVIVMAAKDVSGVVLLQAIFTFIGLGQSSAWGLILVEGRDWIISPGGIFTYWWVFLPATLALILFGIGWNLIGDGLNDALNPRSD